ncbi:major facilitator superfamily domain-containing protein [Hirsutella rhossiliensis]|uniref:Major facilitator superfamily domain-containing protein n=1 Tax=Hirsutella rhossiliensis TaxID=111463 RepID=A0A9P8N400_9HYPO|nr:major facilitator superfamily domain-containing protein [Hirsutella rhossiliensis]KAH0966172.1 major facilitator superfamily domain-containing protein [Hirsutella rhossiliensis]
MAWGVLDDPHTKIPPGTVSLTSTENVRYRKVKKHGNIVLQPQPSDCPNDPLNWSWTWKIGHFLVIALGSSLTNAVTVMVAPGLVPLSEALGVSQDEISVYTIGAVAFWTAIGGFITVSGADTFPSLVIMRTMTGFASAPLLLLAPATISDIFFAHERGTYIAIFGAVLNGGGQLGQVIAGFIIDSMGVPALFKFTAVAYATLLVIAYFVVLESAYFDRENAGPDEIHEFGTYDDWSIEDHKTKVSPDAKEKYSQSIPVLTSVIVTLPPYNLTPAQVGLTYLPLVGVSLVGGPLFGWILDAVARFMATRNKIKSGVFEPEFRLVSLLVCAPLSTAGLVGLGVSIDKGLPLAWALVSLSAAFLGFMWTTQAVLTYVVDCFPIISGQAFTLINLFAAAGIFVASGGLINWYIAAGPAIVFNVLAAIGVAVTALTIPAYIFGKRLRGKIARVKWTRSLIH